MESLGSQEARFQSELRSDATASRREELLQTHHGLLVSAQGQWSLPPGSVSGLGSGGRGGGGPRPRHLGDHAKVTLEGELRVRCEPRPLSGEGAHVRGHRLVVTPHPLRRRRQARVHRGDRPDS